MCEFKASTNEQGGCAEERPIETIGSNLDRLIRDARKHLEELCIRKARAEAAQLLDHPLKEMRALCNDGYPF